MKELRFKNATRNIKSGFLNKIVLLLFPFVIRTILIKKLGSDYLGLNSLFTSILQVLNLAELGFSSAIVYNMYEPVAKNDIITIGALVGLYKKIYRIIGICISIIGLLILPFLKFLTNNSYPDEINIYIVYLLYLLNTSLTYFLFAYKSSLLIAYQRNDIVNNIQTIISIIQYIIQIVMLLLFNNFYLFLLIQILSTIVNNISISIIVEKKYPNYKTNVKVNSNIKKEIKKSVTGLMINKLCYTTRNSLDSIFISSFLGLNMVALYTNYYSIMAAINNILNIITNSILSGIGNSIVTESQEKNYKNMDNFNFIYMWLSGWCMICLLCLYQPFMKIWMGQKYLLSIKYVILFCIYFYVLKMGDIRATYSDAKGLWWENKYRAIVESIANIFLNLILGYFFGLTGIILATLISLFIINFCYGSQILFKHYFTNIKISDYFVKNVIYFTVTIIVASLTYITCSFVKTNLLNELLIETIICILLPNILYLIFYIKTKSFKNAYPTIKKIIKHLIK